MSLASSADPVNRRILAVAEDQVQGFHPLPFDVIASRCGMEVETVLQRLRAMLAAGVVRRVRQTLLSTHLAEGALVAWQLPEERLEFAWSWLCRHDPFTGHVVLRRSERADAPGADFRLWTTLKVPTGCGSVDEHCRLLQPVLGARTFIPLPVVGMFALGVGHVRRAGLLPGTRLPEAPVMQVPTHPRLTKEEWRVLLALKESLRPEELQRDPWSGRARQLGMAPDRFLQVAQALDEKHVIGRFATFLDHTRPADARTGTGASGLFHWAVPPGEEERAGAECGRHICMTHCYWRKGGEAFGGAQIMGVVHASTREKVLEHKAAIDEHLAEAGLHLRHTAVFWSEKAEIRPSEINPEIYACWRRDFPAHGRDFPER